MANRRAKSKVKKDFFGNEYIQYYDENGNETDRSKVKKGFFGGTYTEDYDENGNRTGTSKVKKGIFGGEKVEHYDGSGRKTGESRKKKGILSGEYTQNYDESGRETGRTEKKKGCFVTTACVEAMGLPDDCRELTVLRRYRDEWLVRQPGGQALVEAYYDRSPALVDAIAARADARDRFRSLYADVRTAVELVEQSRPEEAREAYVRMVRGLEAEYGEG